MVDHKSSLENIVLLNGFQLFLQACAELTPTFELFEDQVQLQFQLQVEVKVNSNSNLRLGSSNHNPRSELGSPTLTANWLG